MSKLEKDFIKEVLKGVWSPFFRRKISKEIKAHIEDLVHNENLHKDKAIKKMGVPSQLNETYKKLFHKKLKNDFYLFGTFSTILFFTSTYYISSEVEAYLDWNREEYLTISKKYNEDIDDLYEFKRNDDSRNAAEYFHQLLLKKEIGTEFLTQIGKYDFWNSDALLLEDKSANINDPSSHVLKYLKLVKASYKNLELSDNKKEAMRQHHHLAKLIYSTETMTGFRLAQNMMEGRVFGKDGKIQFYNGSIANRVSGVMLGLLTLKPTIIEIEKELRNKNYYRAGICHHAKRFWFQDDVYRGFLKSDWPLEYKKNEELIAAKSIKLKMIKECRLSFLKFSKSPGSITMSYLISSVDNQEKSYANGWYQIIPERAIFSLAYIPYFRALAGRYVIWRTSMDVRGEAYKFYKDKV